MGIRRMSSSLLDTPSGSVSSACLGSQRETLPNLIDEGEQRPAVRIGRIGAGQLLDLLELSVGETWHDLQPATVLYNLVAKALRRRSG